MPMPDWTVPMRLTTPSGYLDLNTNVDADGVATADPDAILGAFTLRQDACDASIEVRIERARDNVPQADGYTQYDRFLSGTDLKMTVQLWEERGDTKPACDMQRVLMYDLLARRVRSMKDAADNSGRLAWVPYQGATDYRMQDDVKLYGYLQEGRFADGAGLELAWLLDSPFPYAQNLTQTRTACEDGDTVTISNVGSAEYYPVIEVNMFDGVPDAGAVASFLIENLTTGEQFSYLGAGLPGGHAIAAGGHWIEIDCFTNRSTKDGDVRNEAAGIAQLDSEYWLLAVGDNDIRITGCDMDVLWAPAWG